MHRLAALAVAALLVLSGVVAPVAATDPEDEKASFGDSDVTVMRGEKIDITVSHSTNANLTIGSQSSGFEVRIPLGGSGSDTITFDTYATTSPNPSDFLSTGGELLSRPISESIEPGQYDMEITIGGVTQAVGNLEVTPRGETTGTTLIAPGGLSFDETSAGGVLDSLTERKTVARGDYVGFLVNESGLSWAFPEKATANAALGRGLSAELVELDPEPNTLPERFNTSRLRVVSAVPDRNKFAVLWDTSAVNVGEASNNTYGFRLSLTADSELTNENQTLVRQRVKVVRPSVSISATPGFELAPWDDKRLSVSGETNLAPGTTLDVRALQRSPRQELWRNLVDVSKSGTFAAEFTFTRAVVPNDFPLWVLNYRSQTEETVELTEGNASLSFPNQTVSEDAVTVSNVSLSHGGFVRVATNESTLGASEFLQAGDHDSVRVPVTGNLSGPTNATAVAVADANRNLTLDDTDATYEVNGTVVQANATLEPPADQTDPPDTTTPPSTTSTTPTDTTTSTTVTTTQRRLDTETSEPLAPAPAQGGSGGSSGGIVPLSPVLALAALAAAGALAARR
jgi:hypothetical protein